MRAAFVPYRSSRRLQGQLHGMGDTTAVASSAGSYAGYAKAIYQAYKGDLVGGIYNAAVIYAGPVAQFMNSVANYLNAPGKRDSAILAAFLQAMVDGAGFGYVYIPRGAPFYLTPDGKTQLTAPAALETARAVANGMSGDFIADKFKGWLATGKPFNPDLTRYIATPPREITDTPIVSPPAAPPAPLPSPVPIPVPLPTPSPAPIPIPVPIVPTPAIVNAPPAPPVAVVLPAAPDAPALTVSAPSSVPPDQTPALIQALIDQGASRAQTYTAALQSLAARGVPASPPVQALVSQNIASASNPSAASGMLPLIGLAALFGVALILKGLR